jgi:hypothetical protein
VADDHRDKSGEVNALFGCKKKVEEKKVGGMIVEGMKLGGM